MVVDSQKLPANFRFGGKVVNRIENWRMTMFIAFGWSQVLGWTVIVSYFVVQGFMGGLK